MKKDGNMILDWVNEELNNIDLGDKRLNRRILNLVSAMGNNPEASIPQACKTHASTKAAYRFFNNPHVVANDISETHIQRTIERVRNYDMLLIAQDTTNIDFSSHKGVTDIGYLDNICMLGLKMHSGLAISLDGVPEGLLYQKIWTRDMDEIGKNKDRKKKNTKDKESFRWLDVVESVRDKFPENIEIVHIADREADMYDLFVCAQQQSSKILIRAVHNRKVEHECKYLWDAIQESPIRGNTIVNVGRANKHKPRKAKLNIRYETLNISPPRNHPQHSPYKSVCVNVILAEEVSPPLKEKPLCWLLITTLPITTLDDALQYVDWYSFRWLIERFHYVLKSGCKIEELQLEKMDRLRKAIATYSIIAWRLLQITYESRKNTKALANTVLEKHEWEALYCITFKTPLPPKEIPTLHESVRWIAKLGGFLGRKSDGEPGVKVIWRGFSKLYNYADMWSLLRGNGSGGERTCG
jgi:hypothetical protein